MLPAAAAAASQPQGLGAMSGSLLAHAWDARSRALVTFTVCTHQEWKPQEGRVVVPNPSQGLRAVPGTERAPGPARSASVH